MIEVIRHCSVDDAGPVAQIYDPIVANTTISFEEIPPGPEEMNRRIAAARDWFPWLVFERDGIVAGFAYAAPHRSRAAYRWAVDVSVYVAPEARRLGISRKLYVELFRILTGQGYCAAFAGVALPNEPSCNLHESFGFTTVGVYHAVGFKRGAWRDVLWFERRLRPANEPPPELVAFTDL
ncbi:MAG: GNAT family N-acetyltransferase [Candidatus Meridianibacter frigidus]|nr:MAG: GNAT family N-acetyltransferase [Candidatus Eremiobacteraeota bacterium]